MNKCSINNELFKLKSSLSNTLLFLIGLTERSSMTVMLKESCTTMLVLLMNDMHDTWTQAERDTMLSACMIMAH